MIYEIASVPLKEGLNIDDASSPEGKVWRDCINMMLSVEGFKSIYFGLCIEDPSILQCFMGWESKGRHEAFKQSSAHKPFVENLIQLARGRPLGIHVDFPPPSATPALFGPGVRVTELAFNYFQPPLSEAEKAKLEAEVVEMRRKMMEKSGCVSVAGGWVAEEMPLPKSPGEMVSVHCIVVGWEDVEAHKRFEETEEFKTIMGFWGRLKQLKDTQITHVKLQEGRGDSA